MAIQTSDVTAYRSTQALSDGGAMSGTPVVTAQLNNLFADITDDERLAGVTKYRKMFWRNGSSGDAMDQPVMWATVLPEAGLTLSLGLGFDSANDDDPFMGNMLAVSAPSVITVASDGPDTRAVTVWGVDSTAVPTSETVALSGATEITTATVFSKVWAVVADAESGTRIIEVLQGPGGNALGSIGLDRLCCWLWVPSPNSKGSGIALPDLPPGSNYGMWQRLVVAANADAVRPGSHSVAIEEA